MGARGQARRWPLLATGVLCGATAAAIAFATPGAPGGGSPGPEPTALAADGSLDHTNSRDGMPVLTAAGIGPGDSVEGSVTIANTGTVGGAFSLSAGDVADSPGAGGGALSERLRLRVRDLASTTPAYDGPLTGLVATPVGYFAPGASRDYAIVATLPDGPADNAYAGSSASFRLVWHAVEADPPDGPPGSDDGSDGPGRDVPGGRGTPPAPDDVARPPAPPRPASPLRLTVRVPRVQRVLARKRVLVRVRCDRPCRLAARGSVRVGDRRGRLRTWRSRGGLRRAGRPRVRIPRGLRPAARHALARHRRVVFRVAFVARDRSGQRTVVRRRLVLRALRDLDRARIVSRPIGARR